MTEPGNARFAQSIGCDVCEYEVLSCGGAVACIAFVRDLGSELRVVLCVPGGGMLPGVVVPVDPTDRATPGALPVIRRAAVHAAVCAALGMRTTTE